jgi:protein gp37
MSDGSKIEWLCAPGYRPAAWNPTRGCSRVSKGCKNCYAERVARRFSGPGMPYERLVDAKGRWTGQVKIVYKKLGEPMRWRDPRMVFVDSMSDLFHEAVPDEWIDQVFAAMALCPQHRFLVLTKRPARMQEYLSQSAVTGRIFGHYMRMGRAAQCLADPNLSALFPWPLPNVWLGVSVEDQATADERIPLLLDTPAAVRWISAEPLLDPLDLSNIPWPASHVSFPDSDDITALRPALVELEGTRIDWVVAGGESGPDARPSHPDWFRSLRDQCQLASKRSGVGFPFFFKQWGDWAPNCLCDSAHAHPTTPRPSPGKPGVMFRCGKRNAGRLLDGREWNEYPVTDP